MTTRDVASLPAEITIRLEAPGMGGPQPTPRQLHGLVSTLLGESDAQHVAAEKPWSAVLLDGERGRHLRIGWLAAADPPALDADTVRLGPRRFHISRVDQREFGFAELAQDSAWEVGLELITPTWFMRGGVAFPFADPLLVFGRLAQRWNVHAPEPMAIPDWLRDALLDDLELISWSGGTQPFDIGRGVRPGFVGRVVAGVSDEAPAEVCKVLATLARFAELAGVGAQTTFGAGHVRCVLSGS